MLLPSALPCDTMRHPLPQSHPRLFSTPPPSSDDDVASQATTGNGSHNTSQTLQTLLGSQMSTPATSAERKPLLSPIAMMPRMKVSKKISKAKAKVKAQAQSASAPRGMKKRSWDIADDNGHAAAAVGNGNRDDDGDKKFSTPKRVRLAPLEMPLGIKLADYEGLESLLQQEVAMGGDMAGVVRGEGWSADDDRVLVEGVLEKLSLTKEDWNECARKLGRESGSVGGRWTELVGEGRVGLKRGRRLGRGRGGGLGR